MVILVALNLLLKCSPIASVFFGIRVVLDLCPRSRMVGQRTVGQGDGWLIKGMVGQAEISSSGQFVNRRFVHGRLVKQTVRQEDC